MVYVRSPCLLYTSIDFTVAVLVIILLIVWNNSRSKYSDLIILGIFILITIYSIFRKQLHTSFGVSTDVNMFGRPMPKYCQ